MSTPSVLLGPEFAPLWRQVAATLDRRGVTDRGWVTLPDDLPDAVYARLGEVTGKRLPTARKRLDLAALERGLARHGSDVATLLADAGCAPTGRKEAREALRHRRRERDDVLTGAAHDRLGDEPWVVAWTREVRPTVPDEAAARWAVEVVAGVLAAAAGPDDRSRAEVAARVLGDAHALDRGTTARRWVGAALALRADAAGTHDTAGAVDRDAPELWDAAGLPSDLVATPVLTWALPLLGDGAAAAVRASTAAGLPAPLTRLALRESTIAVPPGTVVTSVENPRVLEAAVQRGVHAPMLCTAGNPTRAVTALVTALLAAGAAVRHHGDLDPAGIAITARLAALGVTPWHMTAADYAAALAAAGDVALRAVRATVPPTPWDAGLAVAIERAGLAVDEERVMDDLLAELADEVNAAP